MNIAPHEHCMDGIEGSKQGAAANASGTCRCGVRRRWLGPAGPGRLSIWDQCHMRV
jgi:hypothetical protein